VTVPLWAAELAADFWALAGAPGPFPRDLAGPIADALDLTVTPLPALRLSSALAWLAERGLVVSACLADRRLRGLLVAARGVGFIFLDAEDDEAERRFSLAHELAHFLRDYRRPRRAAVRRLGAAALEVLDGARPPRPDERLHALLGGVRIGCHAHLLARTEDGPVGAEAVAEDTADRLAWELLAPADAVLAEAGADRAALERLLAERYGLPPREAERYAAELLPRPPVVPLVERLRRALG
jgi:Zn-dependent peptidase ImmA (M78 family)